MSKQSNRDSDRDHGRRNKPGGPRRSAHLKSPKSLERLRDRVQAAAVELERLRQENEALSRRISELEARPAVDLEGTVLTFDEDPDTLRRKVEDFIHAIDNYLARENG